MGLDRELPEKNHLSTTIGLSQLKLTLSLASELLTGPIQPSIHSPIRAQLWTILSHTAPVKDDPIFCIQHPYPPSQYISCGAFLSNVHGEKRPPRRGTVVYIQRDPVLLASHVSYKNNETDFYCRACMCVQKRVECGPSQPHVSKQQYRTAAWSWRDGWWKLITTFNNKGDHQSKHQCIQMHAWFFTRDLSCLPHQRTNEPAHSNGLRGNGGTCESN